MRKKQEFNSKTKLIEFIRKLLDTTTTMVIYRKTKEISKNTFVVYYVVEW